MRRRALLACALPAVISGCLGSDPADDENDSGGDDENATDTDDDENATDTDDDENATDTDDDENATDTDDDENATDTDDDGNEVGESRYRVVVEAPEADPGEEPVCEFESLPDAAREEFEAAIDGVDFETDDRGHYTSTDSPAILDTDCYNVLIAYGGEYYPLIVEVDSG